MAGQFDPILAVATSDLDPLPHQIQAVYGTCWARRDRCGSCSPMIRARIRRSRRACIKELVLREDAARVLIVVPGGLVDQWQDELRDKCGLRFEILTRDLIDATLPGENPFHEHPS